MALTSTQQLTNTRTKLARLEERYETLRSQSESSPRVRELSMRSLKRLINQFKEEIARYEAQEHASQR